MRSNETRFSVRINRWLLGFSQHWLRYVVAIIGIYATLPFVAPTLMKMGLTDVGRALYQLYSPFCHQFAFRSVFLYGEQWFYPRYNTGSELVPFESYVQNLPEFAPEQRYLSWPVGDIYQFSPGYQWGSREFLGNDAMGYKTTLCARDVAIYQAMFWAGLLYAIPSIRRRLRPAPLWLYVILGLGPIGLDGFSQLLGYPPFNLWPARETLPIFRILTGALFGIMNVWLGFPYLAQSMNETRYDLEEKFRRANIAL